MNDLSFATRNGTFGATVFDRPMRHVPFSLKRLPTEGWRPLGEGQGPMRELLSFAAKRTEQLRYRWDGGDVHRTITCQDMYYGNVEALEAFGITRRDRIEQTDLPLSFAITSPDGSARTLSFEWDGSQDDMMSLPPHIVRFGATGRATVAIGVTVGTWAAIAAIAKALGAF